MCGVVGIRRFDGRPPDRDLLQTMTNILSHRGPDDSGTWVQGDMGFGHRRLSIIDVAKSAQPMVSASGRSTICFNGEILNYRKLRSEISYPFVTDGDTETLLALYERHGMEMLGKLRGQFAFGLFDQDSGDLWLARDRLGILPLYYYRNDRFLAFASEIKALLPVLPQGGQLDQSSVREYLTHRSVPAPSTLFAGVRKLRPGSTLMVGGTGEVKEDRYWCVPDFHPNTTSPANAVDRLHAALKASVAESLVADVPVGAYLSGGVDSSLIVGMMAQLHSGEVNTFSAGFGDARYDETRHARDVSVALGTNHHEVVVTPADFAGLWEQLTWNRDAPLSEPADVAVFRLAELARSHVKVVLSGEGSDELFAGYPKHRMARLTRHASRIPSVLRSRPLSLIERGMPASMGRARIAARALAARDEQDMARAWFSPFTDRERTDLVGPGSNRPSPAHASSDPLYDMLAADMGSWLSDNLLERGDRMSMAASLELRPPFLDARVVDLAFELPSEVKLRDGVSKWVVKEVARHYVPAAIVDRRKVGFRVPLNEWFRAGLNDEMRSRLLDAGSVSADIFDRKAVEGLISSHESGRRDESIRLWTLVSFEVWALQCLRRS